MLAPVTHWERATAQGLGLLSTLPVFTVWLVGVVLLVPWIAGGTCAALARLLGRVETPVRELVTRFAPALVPVGFSMWLAHFAFHLATGATTAGPAFGRALHELGLGSHAEHASAGMAMSAAADPGLQIALLGLGLVVSVAVAWRIARERVAAPARALGLAAPWCVLALALYGLGVWISLQPMEMRGVLAS
jgi:uncharacterized protein YggT (Ycf19 family)